MGCMSKTMQTCSHVMADVCQHVAEGFLPVVLASCDDMLVNAHKGFLPFCLNGVIQCIAR